MLTFKKNKFGQVSLVANNLFLPDAEVFNLDMGEFSQNSSLRSIELSPNLHVVNPWGAYTNHSCSPNCYVDKTNRVMRAKKYISIGEEITFNYLDNESKLSTSFQCKCGSDNCVVIIDSPGSKRSYLDK
jgi:hypothetical protein